LRFLHFVFLTLAATTAGAQSWAWDDGTVPFVVTPREIVERMLRMAEVGKDDYLIDLGSGDGRIVLTAAKVFGARGFGVEIKDELVRLSNEAAQKEGLADRVKFLRQDLFDTDFRQADVLTLYLLPDVNLALRPKILADLKPGTRVVSHDYDMREWRPDAQETLPAPGKTVGLRKESAVYLWIVPARAAGRWELEIDAGGKRQRASLELKQQYQMLSGTVGVSGGGRASISDGKLRGDELRMTLPGGIVGEEPLELVGRIAGDGLSGSARREGREIAIWSARRRR